MIKQRVFTLGYNIRLYVWVYDSYIKFRLDPDAVNLMSRSSSVKDYTNFSGPELYVDNNGDVRIPIIFNNGNPNYTTLERGATDVNSDFVDIERGLTDVILYEHYNDWGTFTELFTKDPSENIIPVGFDAGSYGWPDYASYSFIGLIPGKTLILKCGDRDKCEDIYYSLALYFDGLYHFYENCIEDMCELGYTGARSVFGGLLWD